MLGIALIASDPLYSSWLADVLGDDCELHWLRPDDPDDPVLAQLARLETPDAILVEPNPTLVRDVAEATSSLVAAVSMDSLGDTAITLVRAGASDIFIMGRDDGEIRQRMDALLRSRMAQPRGNETGVGALSRNADLTVLLGPGGNGDLSFCGVHLALALLQRVHAGERVLLMDLGLPCGASLVHLDLNQSYSILDAVNDTYRCDASLIDSAFARHGSEGLYLLSVPEDQVGPAPLGEVELGALLPVLREHFRHIVVVAGPHWPIGISRYLLESATHAAFVSDGGIVNSRSTRAFLQVLRQEDVSLGQLGLICDSARGVQALDAGNLARLLELPLWADLRGSPQARAKAVNRGEPLFHVAPRDATAKTLMHLASRLHAGRKPTEPASSSGLWDRLTGG